MPSVLPTVLAASCFLGCYAQEPHEALAEPPRIPSCGARVLHVSPSAPFTETSVVDLECTWKTREEVEAWMQEQACAQHADAVLVEKQPQRMCTEWQGTLLRFTGTPHP